MATEGRDGMWPFYVAHIPVNGPKHTHASTGSANGLSGFTNRKTVEQKKWRNVLAWVWGKGEEGELDRNCTCVKFSRISQNIFENLGICIYNPNIERADRWIPTAGWPMG